VIVLPFLFAIPAAALVLLMGMGATSRVDFALGVATVTLVYVGWNQIEARVNGQHDL
jgi:hypothetical protein